jgi:hypothetical protein
MRLPRCRVRALMLVVALTAVGIRSWDLYRDSCVLRLQAGFHAEAAAAYEQAAKEGRDVVFTGCGFSPALPRPSRIAELLKTEAASPARIAEMYRLATYHKGMQQKYERAAFRPWVRVPRDPAFSRWPHRPLSGARWATPAGHGPAS